jgi:hypothetical protein
VLRCGQVAPSVAPRGSEPHSEQIVRVEAPSKVLLTYGQAVQAAPASPGGNVDEAAMCWSGIRSGEGHG